MIKVRPAFLDREGNLRLTSYIPNVPPVPKLENRRGDRELPTRNSRYRTQACIVRRSDAMVDEAPKKRPMSESEIDEVIEASFPASDPPSWTLGTDHSPLARRDARSAPGTSRAADDEITGRARSVPMDHKA